MFTRTRTVAFVLTVVMLATLSIAYAWWRRPSAAPSADQPADQPVAAVPRNVSLAPGPRLLAVTDRHLSTVPSDAPGGPRTLADVECVRAYAAAGTGVCLRPSTPWSYEVVVLSADLAERQAFGVPGLPNRARVSASGRMVAWTTFVGGDSYADGHFAVRTGILDTRTGTVAHTLEDFAVVLGGAPYRSIDVNVWGVTFAADDNAFYATLFTGGRRYLVRGDWAARTVRTLAENVECPSLSPDGTRIAFKQAVDADPAKGWRLSTMDLATMSVTHTAERASVDDQAAWLDDRTLGYTLRGKGGRPDIWSVPADGSGGPRLLVPGAESPSPLR